MSAVAQARHKCVLFLSGSGQLACVPASNSLLVTAHPDHLANAFVRFDLDTVRPHIELGLLSDRVSQAVLRVYVASFETGNGLYVRTLRQSDMGDMTIGIYLQMCTGRSQNVHFGV